jgi:AraC family transcriptional regulator
MQSPIKEYLHRINLVLDYIDQHIDQELSLEELSNVAAFSKYHFHRIFVVLIGETLFQYIRRIRLEKACFLLLSQTDFSITEIAFKTGFSTPSGFTRSFSEYYGSSPSQWRKDQLKNNKVYKQDSNMNQELRNFRKDTKKNYCYDILQLSKRRIEMNKNEHEVVVKECPEKTVAYVRYIGPYKGDADLFAALSQKLYSWAAPRNLVKYPDTEFIIVYHDNPDITEESKLRVSVCITVPKETQVEGEIGKMVIPAGKYAYARFRLGNSGYQEAWDWVYGQWLPASGYAPDDRPCFEQYYNSPEESPDGMMDLDIVIPVKPL